jgi:hypothetical protein
MSKIRLFVLLLTVFVVGTVATLISLYARGYRFDSKDMKINPNGLLAIKSVPDGAQIYVDGELKTATNATIPLPPATYDISVKKDGFLTWSKRLTIDKEVVTEATAHLFKSTPSLSAVTFSGVQNPVPSGDFTKIAYVVPSAVSSENQGMWVMETVNLPLGFARDPKRITDGNLDNSSFIWSPDGSQILLTTAKGVFLVPTNTFTPQAQRVNVSAQKEKTLKEWDSENTKLLQSQIKKLPNELQEILTNDASEVQFSPDEDMVLYSASSSATIKNNLIPQLPGASTQKQERDIKTGNTYVYDIKEDRNFLVDKDASTLEIRGGYSNGLERRMSWYPSSRNLILSDTDKVIIMDYDGTNQQSIYSGSYVAPNAFPTLSFDRILILTNLGASATPANLYSLSLK